ncbi:MAG: histidinol-phosphatase [Treponema sp.]|jgi:histidinol-phosphatase (PHP family)|nr:histidinol-phosphatase [Treponema sp.]
MRFSCLHTHTLFCDGHDDIETFCRAALEKGLVSLGFSAHAPLPPESGLVTDWHLPPGRLAGYLEAVRAAARRWAGRIPVYLGLEADYITGRTGPASLVYPALGLDYLIGSVHYILPPDGGEPFAVDSSPEILAGNIGAHFGGDGEALMECYWEAVSEMCRAGGFDILGHLDLVKKSNGALHFFDESGPRYRRASGAALDAAARAGVVVEINTGGMNRGWIREPYPSGQLLKMLAARDIPLCLNADAHRAADLDGHYTEALAAARDAGCRSLQLFNGSQDRWEREALEPF